MIPDRRDPLTNPSMDARGLGSYTHRVRSRAPSDRETRPSLSTPWSLLRARGACRASGSRSTRSPSPILGFCSAYDASQGPGARKHAPSHRGSRAPRHCTLGVSSSAAPPIGSHTGRDTRRQAPPQPPGARGLLGPCACPSSRPPSPPRRLQKACQGETGPSRHSLTLRVSE